MRVQIHKYVIKSDAYGWASGEPYTYMARRKDGPDEPMEGLRDPSYHSRLDHALTSLLDRSLRESDARSLREVVRLIREFRAECAELFTVRMP